MFTHFSTKKAPTRHARPFPNARIDSEDSARMAESAMISIRFTRQRAEGYPFSGNQNADFCFFSAKTDIAFGFSKKMQQTFIFFVTQ
ncbi:MAG: hypothetical protein ACI4BD_04025 [Paludibacteraceae bacterium]